MAGFFDKPGAVPVVQSGKESFFDAPTSTATPVAVSGKESVEKTLSRSFWDAPVLTTEPTTDDELSYIAGQTGVDPEVVRDMATYFGAERKGGFSPEELESSLGRGVGFNVPQFYAKKGQDPNVRAAIDMIQELANQKRSFARGLAENIIPVGAIGRAFTRGAEKVGEQLVARSAVKAAAKEGAVMGGVGGVAGSQEGQEVQSGLIGTAAGTVIGATAAAVGGKLASRGTPRTPGEKRSISRVSEDLPKAIEEARIQTAESERAMRPVLLGEKKVEDLTPDEVNSIFYEQVAPSKKVAISAEEQAKSDIYSRTLQEAQEQEAAIRSQEVDQRTIRNIAEEQAAAARPESRTNVDLAGLDAARLEAQRDVSNTSKQLQDLIRSEKSIRQRFRGATPEQERLVLQELADNNQRIEDLSRQLELKQGRVNQMDEVAQATRAARSELNRAEVAGRRAESKLGSLETSREKIARPGERSDGKLRREAVTEFLDNQQKELDSYLGADTARENLGAGYVRDKYNLYLDKKLYQLAQKASGAGVDAPSGLTRLSLYKLGEPQFVSEVIDAEFGLRTGRALQDLSNRRNLQSHPRTELRKDLNMINTVAREAGIDSSLRNGQQLRKAISEGIPPATPAEARIRELIKSYNARVLQEAAGQGVEIKGIDPNKYITSSVLDIPDMLQVLDSTLSKVKSDTGNKLSRMSGQEFQELVNSNKAANDLVGFLKWKGDVIPTTGAELMNAIRMNSTQDGIEKLDRIGRSVHERTGEIPELIRENNIYKILDKYAHNLLSYAFQRKPLDELRLAADKLEVLGADVESQYIRKIVLDAQGIRKHTVAGYMNRASKTMASMLNPLITKAEEAGKPVTAMALRTAKATPELFSFLGKQVYSNLLGYLNLKAPIQNVIGGITRTAPEIGGVNGYITYFRGMVDAVANWREMKSEVRRLGLRPAEIIREGERALADGFRASDAGDWVVRNSEALGKLGMAIYKTSEDFNIGSIIGASRRLAADIMSGKSRAIQTLADFPDYVQFDANKAISEKNPKELYEVLVKHLVRRTAFNYDRPSMFELGRTLGPIFSTFTKWSTAIPAEVLSEIKLRGMSKGVKRGIERLVVPLIAAAAIDHALASKFPNYQDSDLRKKLLGKYGFKSTLPINAMTAMLTGDTVFNPVAIDTLIRGVINPAIRGDTNKLEKGLDKVLFNYGPNAGFARMLGEDLATYITGEKPTGGTTLERSIEGAKTTLHKINK